MRIFGVWRRRRCPTMPNPDLGQSGAYPEVSDDYARAFEAGALAALDWIAEQDEAMEDMTLAAAEHIGKVIDTMLGRS